MSDKPPTVGHIGQLTTTTDILAAQGMKLPPAPPRAPIPIVPQNILVSKSELDAANARIKELEEQLATKYWEPIRRENVELREKLAKAENVIVELGMDVGALKFNGGEVEQERDALREQVGKAIALRDALNELSEKGIATHTQSGGGTSRSMATILDVRLWLEVLRNANRLDEAINSPPPSPCPTCEKMSAALVVVRDFLLLDEHEFIDQHKKAKDAPWEYVTCCVKDALSLSSPSTPENPPAEERPDDARVPSIRELLKQQGRSPASKEVGDRRIAALTAQRPGIADDNDGNPVEPPPSAEDPQKPKAPCERCGGHGGRWDGNAAGHSGVEWIPCNKYQSPESADALKNIIRHVQETHPVESPPPASPSSADAPQAPCAKCLDLQNEVDQRRLSMCEIVRILGHGCTGLTHEDLPKEVLRQISAEKQRRIHWQTLAYAAMMTVDKLLGLRIPHQCTEQNFLIKLDELNAKYAPREVENGGGM